jgi:hypothetical protein
MAPRLSFGDFPHAEDVLLELRGRLRVLRGHCEMLDLRHSASLAVGLISPLYEADEKS